MRRQRTMPPPTGRARPTLRSNGFGQMRAWVEAWYTTCRLSYRPAIADQELYRLPDAELSRLGYRRQTLVRDITGFDITYPPGG